MTGNQLEIPPNATIRQEYVKCGNPDCQNSHGPYLYAYWKQDKKLNKKYVGKNLEDFRLRKLAKEIKLRPSQLIKFMFIQQEASKDNVLAKQYLEKLRNEEVSIDWAHRAIINSIRQQRMLKMMTIADNRHFSYDNEIELVRFIASEMQKEGLDPNNEDQVYVTAINRVSIISLYCRRTFAIYCIL
jgi:hypothetical protein